MNMSFTRSVPIAALVLGLVTCLPAATIQYVSIEGFLHWGGSSSPREVLDSSSPEFISNLDADGLGTFQFDWTNDTGTLLSSLTFSLFIDPDIGRDTNGFFNEYGEFISLSLPALAPVDAISFGEWEIDEPGYVFGDIYDNVWLGALDNSNAVPSSGPANDVSHALLFEIPQLLPGQVLSVTGTLSRTDAAGLAQHDPDSGETLYFNGYALAGEEPSTNVPEPGSAVLVLAAAIAACIARISRREVSR